MSGEPVFSGRLLAGWIAGAVVVFAISLYLMGGGEVSGVLEPAARSGEVAGQLLGDALQQ